MEILRQLSLFTGYGGFELGLRLAEWTFGRWVTLRHRSDPAQTGAARQRTHIFVEGATYAHHPDLQRSQRQDVA